MKSLFIFPITFSVVAILILSGCEMTTEQQTKSVPPLGRDLVINEVFTLSPDKYYAFSWIEILNPTNDNIKWYDSKYPMRGFAVGADGAVMSTSDDGATWVSETPSSITAKFYGAGFPWDDTGYVAGDNGVAYKLVRNESGGFDFQDLESKIGSLVASGTTYRDVYALEGSTLVVLVGDNGTIIQSMNSGTTWSLPRTSTSTHTLNAISAPEMSTMYVVGDSGTILKGGVNRILSTQSPPQSQLSTDYYGVSFDVDTGWIVGENGAIAFTNDAGIIWSPQVSGVDVPLRSVFTAKTGDGGKTVFYPNEAWAAGDGGVILKTDDYGETWTQLPSGVSTKLNEIRFFDYKNGWASVMAV